MVISSFTEAAGIHPETETNALTLAMLWCSEGRICEEVESDMAETGTCRLQVSFN